MIFEARNFDRARAPLAHGLARSFAAGPANPELARATLEWLMELAKREAPLPPPALVADLGRLILEPGAARRPLEREASGEEAALLRRYADVVWGRLASDPSIARAGDALRRYPTADFPRGLAFLVERLWDRVGWVGWRVGPAVLKEWLALRPGELIEELERVRDEEPRPDALDEITLDLVRKFRDAPELLGPEDVFEIESGTALAEFGLRLALRQTLRQAGAFLRASEGRLPRPRGSRREVSSRLFEEDAYPVGGFSSLSNRGTMESLLQSQLAYMETDDSERPDLFDVKYVRDELLYYARDENAFLRARRAIVFRFLEPLGRGRHKDPGVPYQRVVMALALAIALVRRLQERLREESLRFLLLLPPVAASERLDDEAELLERILRDQIANQSVEIRRETGLDADLEKLLGALSARNLVHVVEFGASDPASPLADDDWRRIGLSKPSPELAVGKGILRAIPAETPLDAWAKLQESLLDDWI